jgi:lipopolysaccharide transport system permease protein
MNAARTTSYEIINEPSGSWLALNWRELWAYRDLLGLLIQRDLTAHYKQTLLGPLWFIVQPVLTTIVFAFVFGRIAGIPTDGIPGPLFYLASLLGWNYFAQNITLCGSTFVNHGHLFAKVWFPRLLVPFATVLTNMVTFAIQLAPFLAFYAYYALIRHETGTAHLSAWALLTPLPLLHTAALSLGVGLWMAASTARFRDLIHLNQFLVQLWLFASPVVYPLSRVPEHWRWLAALNPMAVPLETFRFCLLGQGSLAASEAACSVTVALVLLVSGLAVFQRVARTAVDTV